MVLPEIGTQRPSFPPFANQFEEVERIQTQYRIAAYSNNDNPPSLHPGSSTNRRPLIIRNINTPTPDVPLLPSPILQTRMDADPPTNQEPTPGLHRPTRSPGPTPYPDDILVRRPPPHSRIGIPAMPSSSYFTTPPLIASHPPNRSPHPLPDRPYLPSSPEPLLPPLSPSSPFTVLRRLLHSSFLNTDYSLPPLPPPSAPRQLISLYALRVLPGDILAYGNKINDGCTVTACYPDEGRPDPIPDRNVRDREEGDDEGEEGDAGELAGGPVRINGVIRIRWRDWRTGGELSQLFEGLEVLQVRRWEDYGKEEEEEEEKEGN